MCCGLDFSKKYSTLRKVSDFEDVFVSLWLKKIKQHKTKSVKNRKTLPQSRRLCGAKMDILFILPKKNKGFTKYKVSVYYF